MNETNKPSDYSFRNALGKSLLGIIAPGFITHNTGMLIAQIKVTKDVIEGRKIRPELSSNLSAGVIARYATGALIGGILDISTYYGACYYAYERLDIYLGKLAETPNNLCEATMGLFMCGFLSRGLSYCATKSFYLCSLREAKEHTQLSLPINFP